ncbi:MAG: TetR/AcrR family transcriptional regulator [Gemmataceae bacterium]|nr:TetR/AcrR family transcriptional regulator [Gemmataceae bacterium]MDW8265768.1 TetR/AcrR family transcriptional regulator [Gemmataceae bacterium]
MRTKTPQQAEKMLAAAARLFAGQRFHEVRMEDIAAEAAVGKGTLYRYFADKEELFLALLDRASAQLHDRLQQQVVPVAEPRRRLVAVVATIIGFFDEQPHLLDLIQREEVLLGPDFPWRKTRDELLRLVLETFAEARARKEFVIDDPETAALMLLAGLRGVIRFGRKPRPRHLAERIVRAFLGGHDTLGGSR